MKIWMVLISLLLMAVPCAASGKEAALQMTTALENSATEMQFNYAENLGDGRGITFGCIGFCTGTYDGNILIKHYTELNPGNDLARFIPALDAIDSGSHDAAGGDGNPGVEGLDGFIEAVEGCDDPLFKKAQLDMLDKLYWDPAMKLAEGAGCKNALTKAFIYDMCVRHGPDDAQSIMNEAGSVGDDENAYLERLFQYRDSALKKEGLGDVDRDDGYKQVLEAGNTNLVTPFMFGAYGDMFKITGDPGI
jgi:chitosanase